MLDVHPPHHSISGWRDFLMHLLTITIGLLIALTLQGWLDGLHRRRLVRDAESSLRTEIEANAKSLSDTAAAIHRQQQQLVDEVKVLRQFIKTNNLRKGTNLQVNFYISRFDSLSWKTAQSTGALSNMSYSKAKDYAEIYSAQESIETAEDQTVRDVVLAVAPMVNLQNKDGEPTREDALSMKQHIEIVQGQLLVLDAMVTSLDGIDKKFLAAHK